MDNDEALVHRNNGGSGCNTLTYRYDATLPFAEKSAAAARAQLLEYLTPLRPSYTAVENATTVLYELVHNGIDHGTPCEDHALEVCWEIEAGSLTMHVTDCGTPDGSCPPAHGGEKCGCATRGDHAETTA